MDALTCAHGVGARKIGWKCVGEGPVGMSAWMRGRVRTVWVGGRWKCGEKGRWAPMCADSAGATEKLEMGREKDRWA